MDPSTLPALPTAINVAMVAAAVTGLLLLLQQPISGLPGFGQGDAERSAYLRLLHGALTLLGVVGLAWANGVVITHAEIPSLLYAVLLASGAANFTYWGVNVIANKKSAATASSTSSPGTSSDAGADTGTSEDGPSDTGPSDAGTPAPLPLTPAPGGSTSNTSAQASWSFTSDAPAPSANSVPDPALVNAFASLAPSEDGTLPAHATPQGSAVAALA